MRTSLLLGAVMLLTQLSCKKEIAEPPVLGDPSLVANTTIQSLKSRYNGGQAVQVADDVIIEGVVSCDDRSGNYYQQIAIQDGTGGILLRIAGSNHYTNYPVGRKLYVKCKGLYIGQYVGTIQLGGGLDSNFLSSGGVTLLAQNLQPAHIYRGALNQPIEPVVVNASQLGITLQDQYSSMLIKLVGYEFNAADTAKAFSDADQSGNRIVQGCANPTGNRITLRTSNYSKFASANIPNGNGEIVGVYSYFAGNNPAKQLSIRDENDVQFNGARCGSGPTTIMNTSDLRAMYTGSITYGPNGKRITGVVISDRSTNNLNARNIYLQQGDGLSGIVVRFDANHSFNLGDSIDVNVTGMELSEFNGLLQVNNVPLSYASVRATGKSITPRVATIGDINTNFESWESTLVRILNINSLTGGSSGRWSGSVNLTDATGSIVAFTTASASFANAAYPTTAQSLIGYLTPFAATLQIGIRNPTNDVVAGTGPPPPSGSGLPLTTSPYTQNFDGISAGLPQGFYAKVGATASLLATGDMGVINGWAPTAWNDVSGGAKNFASATGLTSTALSTAQSASTNRVLGIRQTGSVGDPGAAFVALLDNTNSKSNFQLSFQLQSLDVASGRTTPWIVDYGIGDAPTVFTPISTSPTSLTTSPTFGSTTVTLSLPSAVNNQSQKVWIRIVTSASSGPTSGGTRPSSAIDDFQLSWN
ncbi:MAG: DUF5689 domain-containing protein [Bacteroidota bacterium]